MYCLQDDLLHEALTVWEVLYYAAMLRLPRTMTKEQKIERVSVVIKALGIEKCKDTIIGTHLFVTRDDTKMSHRTAGQERS